MGSNHETPAYGAAMRKLFPTDPNFLNLNHGSFGTYPFQVRAILRQFQDEVEARPDPFVRFTTPNVLDDSREAVARILNVPRDECVLVKNATTAVATILHNLRFEEGDVIVNFSTVYGGVERGIMSLIESTPLQVRKVEYQMPITHEELVKRFLNVIAKTRAEGLRPKIALFDVVTSMPALRFPFERLTDLCRQEGILSLIDGAHGIGHLPLDLSTFQPDFFTSNCHKWLFVPRSCSVLYVPKRNQHLIRTTIPTSWGFIPAPDASPTGASVIGGDDVSKSAFENLFEFVATNDDTPYFCIPAAIKFRKEVCGGEDQICSYLETLANEAADAVAAILGTEVLQEPNLAPGEQSQWRKCGMTNVRLPIAIQGQPMTFSGPHRLLIDQSEAPLAVKWVQTTLTEQYNTFVPAFAHGGWLWVRLSAQIYLEKKDFESLGAALKEMCDRLDESAGSKPWAT